MERPSAPVKNNGTKAAKTAKATKIPYRERQKKRRELRRIFLNGVLFKNPMLVGALGMFPLVTCTTLKNALELSFLLLVISIPVNVVLCYTGNLVPGWVRPTWAAAISLAVYAPASIWMDSLFPGSVQSLGMAAALMAVNSMVLSRANEYAPAHIFSAVIADTLGCTLGGAMVLCLTAVLREWITYGDVGMRTMTLFRGKGISLPFFGFLILGFLAAGVQHINRRRSQPKGKKVDRL